jgi:hypothetical protein
MEKKNQMKRVAKKISPYIFPIERPVEKIERLVNEREFTRRF